MRRAARSRGGTLATRGCACFHPRTTLIALRTVPFSRAHRLLRRLPSIRYTALLAVLISTSIGVARSDDRNGQSLPGSESDVRGLPNSPFTVDANRLSDGVSSVSPLSTTGPSFHLYRNATDDSGNEAARRWANLTLISRLEQGVSPGGAGSFETAVARYNVLRGDYDSAEKPSISFSVDARERWNPSSFAIEQGETYTIGVPGDQYWQDGHIRADAGGYAALYDAIEACWVAVGRCRAFLLGARPRLPPPRARWMQLVCGIGEFVSPLREAVSGEERYLPISDQAFQTTLLPVGRNLTFTASAKGELVCFANDAEGLYGNNRASLNVTVTRESWPPNGTIEGAYEAYVDDAPTLRP